MSDTPEIVPVRIWFKLDNGHGADICFKDTTKPRATPQETVNYWNKWARKTLGKDVEVCATRMGTRCPWANEKDDGEPEPDYAALPSLGAHP